MFFIWGISNLLDREAESILSNIYLKDEQGIIDGAGPIEVRREGKEAFIFIHGFMAYPSGFKETIEVLHQKRPDVDFYAPLLPYHGRGLREAKKFNNRVIEAYVREFIKDKAQHYDKVYVVASSYAGAILSKLLLEKDFPKNSIPVLQAPALYLTKNTEKNRLKLIGISLFKSYCSAKILGCRRTPESVDAVGYEQEVLKPVLGNIVVPAVKELFAYQVHNQNNLKEIGRPYWIVMAPDDNQVSYDKVKADCDKNKHCHLKIIPSGKHKFHWGAHKEIYWEFLSQLTKRRPYETSS